MVGKPSSIDCPGGLLISRFRGQHKSNQNAFWDRVILLNTNVSPVVTASIFSANRFTPL